MIAGKPIDIFHGYDNFFIAIGAFKYDLFLKGIGI